MSLPDLERSIRSRLEISKLPIKKRQEQINDNLTGLMRILRQDPMYINEDRLELDISELDFSEKSLPKDIFAAVNLFQPTKAIVVLEDTLQKQQRLTVKMFNGRKGNPEMDLIVYSFQGWFGLHIITDTQVAFNMIPGSSEPAFAVCSRNYPTAGKELMTDPVELERHTHAAEKIVKWITGEIVKEDRKR